MIDTRDKQVQDTASLHENAVQAIASGTVDPMPKRRRRSPEKRNQAVHKHLVVETMVLEAAKALLDGSYTRIEIIDAETVMVR